MKLRVGSANRIGPVLLAVLLSGGAIETAMPDPVRTSEDYRHLADTGLYANASAKLVAAVNSEYSPQYPLWSDGAAKRRWVYLPAGTQIDCSNPESWTFPVGTKFWKEFRFSGKLVETRLIEKTAAGSWTFQSFAWDSTGSEATLVSAKGSPNHCAIAEGIRHDIPAVNDCKACHEGTGRDAILGFNALQLSPDRDPLAPHAEEKTPAMIDLGDLISEGRLAHLPPDFAARPPRIAARSPRERAALGYLWANCGGCHNADDPVSSVGLVLKGPTVSQHDSVQSYLRTVIGELSSYEIPELGAGESYRIKPGAPEQSTIVYRMGTRNPNRQMPALGTKVVDQAALELISQWIKEELGAKP